MGKWKIFVTSEDPDQVFNVMNQIMDELDTKNVKYCYYDKDENTAIIEQVF